MALNYYLKAFMPKETDDTSQGKKTKNNPVSSDLIKEPSLKIQILLQLFAKSNLPYFPSGHYIRNSLKRALLTMWPR